MDSSRTRTDASSSPTDADNDIVKSAENFAKDPFDIVYIPKKRFQTLAGCGTLLVEAKNEPFTTRVKPNIIYAEFNRDT